MFDLMKSKRDSIEFAVLAQNLTAAIDVLSSPHHQPTKRFALKFNVRMTINRLPNINNHLVLLQLDFL